MAQDGQGPGGGQNTPIEVAKALGGIDFPKRKQDLINYAQQNADDQQVVDVLSRIPDREYGSMAEVERGVKEAA